MDWSSLYPDFFQTPSCSTADSCAGGSCTGDGDRCVDAVEPCAKKACLAASDAGETPQVEFADVGCGYGGLLGMFASIFHVKYQNEQ